MIEPYMPKKTPTSSISVIILLSQIAIRITKAGLLIADIARTGPAGPPTEIAKLVATIPREATFPQINPVIIKSHCAG